MRRRTPIIAIVLAPVVLYGLVIVWEQALASLYRSIWYGDTVLRFRLASGATSTRISGLKDIAVLRPVDTDLVEKVVTLMERDEALEVRKAAISALGWIGATQTLSEDGRRALSARVLAKDDDRLLSLAVAAVGRSATENRYPDQVVERIVEIAGEKQFSSMHWQATEALGQIGAAQALSSPAFDMLNALFANAHGHTERENLARALAEIAKRDGLPAATVDVLVKTLVQEESPRIRAKIIYALAYVAADHLEPEPLIVAATDDADRNVRSAAENALRIIEHERTIGEREPRLIALDLSQPIDTRLRALQIIKGSGIDDAHRDDIIALASDDHMAMRIAALGLFHYLARSPSDDFDQGVLIPALIHAMADEEPEVREAGVAALARISIHRPRYQSADESLRARLEASSEDEHPRVRFIALTAMLRAAPDRAERDAILERGLKDVDPYVRRMAVSWLSTPAIKTGQRQALFERVREDPHPDVRAAAAREQRQWDARKRAWPIELWKTWQAGEYRKVGLATLTTVTVATPIGIGVIFLLYFTARLLTYLYQRRWRALAAILSMVIWAAASMGMFMLYFAVGHAGDLDAGELSVLVGVLWAAIAAYSGLGWGMHYAVRS